MKVRRYLTRPQSNSETSIFAIINYEGQQIKFAQDPEDGIESGAA